METEENKIDAILKTISETNKELESIKRYVYISDESVVGKINRLEENITTLHKYVTTLDSKYKIFKAEDRKGQWGLFILLSTNLLGWISQFISWALTP